MQANNILATNISSTNIAGFAYAEDINTMKLSNSNITNNGANVGAVNWIKYFYYT